MILKSFVLIEKEGRYLLIQEAARKWGKKWFLPGGKVEINETLENAAHRETKEEAGCDINILGVFYIRYTSGFFKSSLSVFYKAKIAGEEIIKLQADKHSLAVKWFTYDEIKLLPKRQKLMEIIDSHKSGNLIPAENIKIS